MVTVIVVATVTFVEKPPRRRGRGAGPSRLLGQKGAEHNTISNK